MSTRCEIKFRHNTLGIYYAGQTIHGTVELHLAKPKVVQGVFITFDGFAYTTWTERKSYRVNGETKWRTVRYRGRETYLNSKTYMKRAADGRSQFELIPGTHVFDFLCVLPTNLPSSLEGYYGHIRYSIKITLDRPWKFDQKFKRRFTVLKHLDLNHFPDLHQPVVIHSQKDFTWSMFVKGPIKITAKIPSGGFVPGQALPVSIYVDNPSKVDVTKCEIKLKQKVMYYSEYPSRHSRREKKQIAGKQLSMGVPKKTNRQFEEMIIIPSVPPTNTDSCKIIATTYSLLVEFDFSGMHSGKKIKFPIIIGTVPIISPQLISAMMVQVPSAPPVYDATDPNRKEPSAPSYSELDASVLPSYSEVITGHPELASVAPPSYEECVYGGIELADVGNDDDDEADDKGAVETGRFVPLYPVYRFNPSAPPALPSQFGDEEKR